MTFEEFTDGVGLGVTAPAFVMLVNGIPAPIWVAVIVPPALGIFLYRIFIRPRGSKK